MRGIWPCSCSPHPCVRTHACPLAVGLLVFYQPGTIEQLTLGLIVCFVYFGLCCYLMPFGTKTDNLMVCVTQFSLFIAMLSAVIIEHGAADVPNTVVLILSCAALTPAVLGIGLSFQAVFNEIGFQPHQLCCRPIKKAVTRSAAGQSTSPRVNALHPVEDDGALIAALTKVQALEAENASLRQVRDQMVPAVEINSEHLQAQDLLESPLETPLGIFEENNHPLFCAQIPPRGRAENRQVTNLYA